MSSAATIPPADSEPPASAASPAPGVRGKAVRGAMWMMVGGMIGHPLRMLSSVLMSYFVPASVFGLMSLVNLVNQALWMLSDVGIGTSIVQNAKSGREVFLRTAWTVQIVRSFILSMIGCAIAYPVAKFYGGSDVQTLTALIMVSTGSMVINGFMSTSMWTAQRDLHVARLQVFDIAAQVAGLVVMVGAAWATGSVWSVIAGNMATGITRLVLSYTMFKGVRHRPCWDKGVRHELFHFGKWIMLSTMLTFLALQADRLMLPKMLAVSVRFELMGLYGIAMTIATLPVDIMQRIGSGVLLPAYAKTRREGKVPEHLYRQVTTVSNTLGGIAIAGMIASGPGFVRLAYKSTYHDAALLIVPLAVVGWVRILQSNATQALLSMGEAKSSALSNGLKLVGMVTLVPAGFYAGFHADQVLQWLGLGAHAGPILAYSPDLRGLWLATIGLSLAELIKYAILTRDVMRHGHTPFRMDLQATAFIALVGVAVGIMQYFFRAAFQGHPRLEPALEALGSGLVAVLLFLPQVLAAKKLVGRDLDLSKLPVVGKFLRRS
jgi:O-antigen/teichoic acid export membrane protein